MSQCFLDFLLFASSQAEVAADTSYSSGLLHFKLRGWGRFLWHQHVLHPERGPPTDHQLLKEHGGVNKESYKKIFSLPLSLSLSLSSANTCKILSEKGTQGIKDSLVWRTRLPCTTHMPCSCSWVLFLAWAVQQRQVVRIIRLHFGAFSCDYDRFSTVLFYHLCWREG